MDNLKKLLVVQLLVLIITLRTARSQAAGTDCNGRDYLCLDDRRFQICIDLGAGKTETVDTEAQSCPRGTFCSNTGQFECDSHVAPSTAAPQVVTPEQVPQTEPVPEVNEVVTNPPSNDLPVESTSEVSLETNSPTTSSPSETSAPESSVATEETVTNSVSETAAPLTTDAPDAQPVTTVSSTAVPEVPESTSLPEQAQPETTVSVGESQSDSTAAPEEVVSTTDNAAPETTVAGQETQPSSTDVSGAFSSGLVASG